MNTLVTEAGLSLTLPGVMRRRIEERSEGSKINRTFIPIWNSDDDFGKLRSAFSINHISVCYRRKEYLYGMQSQGDLREASLGHKEESYLQSVPSLALHNDGSFAIHAKGERMES